MACNTAQWELRYGMAGMLVGHETLRVNSVLDA
jgi:hypothetical protein